MIDARGFVLQQKVVFFKALRLTVLMAYAIRLYTVYENGCQRPVPGQNLLTHY